jgi:3-oxosteroid 1-dehydrogenase
MSTRDDSFDFVIVGSGGGGLVAALAAAEAGLKPVIIEKQQYVGGSTAMSGGMIWLPNNPVMRADGIPDSYEDGLAYLQSVVGPPDEGSSLQRRSAFLTQGSEMITFLQRKGVKLVYCDGYSDYYDNRSGGHARGRAVEGVPWDGNQLGEWRNRVNPGMARGLRLVVMTNEVRYLPAFTRSGRAFARTAKVVLRTYLARLRRHDIFTNGMSLIGQLTKIIVDSGVPLWLNTAVDELVMEGGRVTGVRVIRDGAPTLVRGRRGVLLSAGGFERNPDMRRKYSGDQPNEAQWTMANPGNTGEVLAAAIALGAKTDHMDEALWAPIPRPELAPSGISLGRQFPRTIFVNKAGARFCNESNSYVEVGQAMYANDAVPAWMIFDDEYRSRYPWARGLPKVRNLASLLPGRMPAEWVANGWVKKAPTLDELARLININPDDLVSTVRQFNEHAISGQDPQFGRGESQYNRTLGDPGNKGNPAVGPIDTGPFYATEIYPGDVGTFGGVITDEHARVLDEGNEPIPGLYATGNLTATVMGRTYPGAGASIASTTIFGFIAARHAALPPVGD